jgi:hypothetical protein
MGLLRKSVEPGQPFLPSILRSICMGITRTCKVHEAHLPLHALCPSDRGRPMLRSSEARSQEKPQRTKGQRDTNVGGRLGRAHRRHAALAMLEERNNPMTTMKAPSRTCLAAVILTVATFTTSCMTTYDAQGRPVQSVDPGAAAATAIAAGAVGYAIGQNNDDRNYYYGGGHRRPHYHGRRGYYRR